MKNGAPRQDNIKKLGLTFLRFDNKEVKQAMNNVLEDIEPFVLAHN